MQNAVPAPVFLVGAERSGTTLLRLMLDHHPELAFHFEFEFAVELISPNGDFPNLDDYRAYLETNRIFQLSGATIDKSLSYAELVNSFLIQKMRRDGKRLVGATVHHHFDRLLHIWPDARFIHLVRDGRDVARSVVNMGWAGNVYHAVDWWIEAESIWAKIRPAIRHQRFLEVRYEALVGDAERELKRVCDFVGVAWDASMLNYSENSTYGCPDARLANQWQRSMSRGDIQLAESKIAELLVARGYECSDLPAITVSRMRRAYLLVQSKFRRWHFRMKRYGFRLFVSDVCARRLRIRDWQTTLKRSMAAIDNQHIR